MMFCQNCDDMASQAPQMLEHLETHGTPIMMGDWDPNIWCLFHGVVEPG